MAFDLVAAYAQSETPFYIKDVTPSLLTLREAPQQITLRFTPGTQISPATLGGISVIRAGGDGSFTDAGQSTVPPVPLGSVLVDDSPNVNQVIIRFAETLPDDTYRIIVGTGLGSANNGSANATQVDVRLDLGAVVTSVVPQPVVRSRLISFTGLPADGDVLEVAIRGVRRLFEFDSNNNVAAGRIRIGLAGATTSSLATAVGNAINTAGFSVDGGATSELAGASVNGSRVAVGGTNFTPVLAFTRAAPGVGSSPLSLGDGGIEQRADRVVVYFNTNDPLNVASAQTAASYRLVETNPSNAASVANVVPTAVSYDAATGTAVLSFATGAVLADRLYRLQIGASTTGGTPTVGNGANDENSSFATATSLGALNIDGITVNSAIDRRPTVSSPTGTTGFPGQPGSVDEPGHRDTPADSGEHGLPYLVTSDATSVWVQQYNFQAVIGKDPQGNDLFNQITEEQKQRAREIFDIYSRYTGVRFVETATGGITVATGDMRAIDPEIPTSPAGLAGGLKAVMDSTDDWGVSEYGGRWFRVAMHEIGHVLGLEHSYDLPSIMGRALPGEAVFPGDYDLVHMRQLYPANGSDVDVYSFTLAEAGRLSAETVVARPGQTATSTLDTVLTLYRQDPGTGRREMVARNDDYYGRDSFVGIDLEAGTYFVVVTSTGNTDFSPEVIDSGYGGRSDGAYQLKLGFLPASASTNTLVDTTGTPLDGDRDGVAGGTFNFWFNTAAVTTNVATNKTLFVDKIGATRSAVVTLGSTTVTMASTVGLTNGMLVKGTGIAAGTTITNVSGSGITLSRAATANVTPVLAFCDGTAAFPFVEIDDAISAVTGGTRIIRVAGNSSAAPYLIGTSISGQTLADGVAVAVPAGVTLMIDEGAIFKLRATVIDVGSSQPGSVSRAGASLQVLGTPFNKVQFTSYHDDSIGGNSDGAGPGAAPGQWGGIVLRQDSDVQSKKSFVNVIEQASFRYGGGDVRVDSQLASVAPIQIESTRPTVAFNTITASAGAAVAATPNSFEDTGDRIGPEIRGNVLTGNSINGLFVKIKTSNGRPLDKLDVPARFKSTDVVYVIQENLVIDGGAGGYTGSLASPGVRQSGRLTIDPGVVVKLASSRIELERGISQLVAEGLPGKRVTFTSLADNRFGAGGTFDTNGSLPDVTAAGDWGGIVLNVGARASIDHAYLGFGGGTTPIEGGFDRFNVIEVHQGDLRLANSRLENNAAGKAGGNRTGRGGNEEATVFVRGAQPIVVGNDFRSNAGAAVSINANSLTDARLADPGRSTGGLGRFAAYDDNLGPLVRGNRISYVPGIGGVAGMVVRGEEITVESVWDDTDIVHVLRTEIAVNNFHTATGLRLQSKPNASLVVKLLGADAGFTATGGPLDIDDRIGGTVQVIGQPGYPVILTSLADDTVGAGFDALGRVVTDTNADGATTPRPGDWRSLKFLEYSNDRNVAVLLEREQVLTGGIDTNNLVATAQQLGILAPNIATTVGGVTNSWDSSQEKSGDENRRLGFEVHGSIAADDPTDVDVYGFSATAGSTVWIDIDKTSPGLDSMVELLDASGRVLARSADSGLEGAVQRGEISFANAPAFGTTHQFSFRRGVIVPESMSGTIGRRISYIDPDGKRQNPFIPTQMFFVAADGSVSFEDLRGTPLQPLTVDTQGGLLETFTFTPAMGASRYDASTGVLTLEFADNIDPADIPDILDPFPLGYSIRDIGYLYEPGRLSDATRGAARMLASTTWDGGDFYSTNPKDAGMRVELPGTIGQSTQYFIRVRSQPGYQSTTTSTAYETALSDDPVASPNGATSGVYELRVRLKQRDEKPGSTVTYADIRYPTTGIDVRGLPRNSLLVGEAGELPSNDNGELAKAQRLGNLLQSDRAAISVAGNMASAGDIDWYTFTLNFEQVQAIAGLNDSMPPLPVVFDIDYADGFRGDLTISLFDQDGRLIYIGRDSNVADDQPGSGQGNDVDDLSRGSAGRLDPLLGAVALAAGSPTGGAYVEGGGVETPDPTKERRYYVAISSNERLPEQLNAFFRGNATNSAIRLQPLSNVGRVVDGGIGAGYKSIIEVDRTKLAALANHVTPFTLSDVTLFVSNGLSLRTVDAMKGGRETLITDTYPATQTLGEIGMRSDGRLYGYFGVAGDRTTAGRFGSIDPGTGVFTPLGPDNIADPIVATLRDLPPTETVAPVTRTTFALGQLNLTRGSVTGTIRLQVVDATATPAITRTSTWDFTTNAAGSVVFTPRGALDPNLPTPDATTSGANFLTGQLAVDWDGNVDPATVRATTVTFTYTNEALASDEVDAFAWRRVRAGEYDRLYFAVRDPLTGRSRLYSADPATASTRLVEDQDWGLKGEITAGGGANIGYTTGMTYVGGTLYGVGSNGHLFTINPANGTATVVTRVTGNPSFTSLAIGPQNLAGAENGGTPVRGYFADKLFATAEDGSLFCLDRTGKRLNVFDSDKNGSGDKDSRLSGVVSPTGLAFSPLDVNLWHPSSKNNGLMYFGFEEYKEIDAPYSGFETAPAVNGQYGVVSPTWQQDLSTNPDIVNTYNMPGGAYGSLTTKPFSLAGYDYTDKPTLYLDYWLQTEDASSSLIQNLMRDSARILVSTDGGVTWERAIATNNGTRASELPGFNSASSRMTSQANQLVQEFYDVAAWRQVRIDLGEYAGKNDIRLRFDFSTAGMFDKDAVNAAGNKINDILDVANSVGNFESPERGQKNKFEGFYLGNLIIGFAERGEQVSGATQDATAFFDVGTPTPPRQVLQGPYQLEIRRGPNELDLIDTNARMIASRGSIGDRNQPREQGQFIVSNNLIRAASDYGISIDAGTRDTGSDMPHPGVPRNLQLVNNSRLVTGVVVMNNVIAGTGIGGGQGSGNGILFSGDPNDGDVARAAVPFGRIVNNTIYGGATPQGVGVTVTQNASPTLVNNLFANLGTGVSVDATSRSTIVAVSGFSNTATQVTGGIAQDRAIDIGTNPFVNAAGGNFYLRAGSSAIDSGLNTLQDRFDFRVVNATIAVPEQPIIAPAFDLYGQFRGDDPSQSPSIPGLGSDVFKDLGAVERADLVQPYATLATPLDQGSGDFDRTVDRVIVRNAPLDGFPRFEVQLNDNGVGIDTATVLSDAFRLERNGVRLVEGTDYDFRYDPVTQRVVFAAAAVFPLGSYVIRIDSRAGTGGATADGRVTDLANNPLRFSEDSDGASLGFTQLTIQLADTVAPAVPTNVTGYPGEDRAFISWTAPISQGLGPVIDYLIQYSVDGVNWTDYTDAESAATSAEVAPLTTNTGYRFRVAAKNEFGTSDWSQPSDVITPRMLAPNAPTNVQAAARNVRAVVTWLAPAFAGTQPITDYEVEYAVETGNPATRVWTRFNDGVSTDLRADPTPLTNGTPYVFRVRAVNIRGSSPWAETASPTTPRGPAAAPTLSGVRGDARVTLNWTTPGNNGGSAITGYRIERTVSGVTTTQDVGVVNTATLTGLTNGTAYSYRVAAITSFGAGTYSSAVSVTPLAVPGTPTNLAAEAGNATVTLSWAPPVSNGGAPISGYFVEYSLGSGTVTVDVGTATSHVITGLTNATSYSLTFRVRARNEAGDGAYSSAFGPTTVIPQAPVAGPTRLTATVSTSTVRLAWTRPTVASTQQIVSYEIQASLSGSGSWLPVGTAAGTATTASVTVPTLGSAHVFRVRALTVTGSSTASVPGQWSNTSIAVTPFDPTALPSAPTNFAVAKSGRTATLSWTPPPANAGGAVTSYVIQYKLSTSGTWLTARSSSIGSLVVGRQYDFRVQGRNLAGLGGFATVTGFLM